MAGGKRVKTVSVREIRPVHTTTGGGMVFELRTSGGNFRTAAHSTLGTVLSPRSADSEPIRLRLEINGRNTVERIESA